MNALEGLAQECSVVSEAHVLTALQTILTAAAHKQNKIRTAAESAAITITTKMSPNSVREVLPTLFANSLVGVAWQSRALALKIIASFADHAPEQLGNSLPEVSCYFDSYVKN